MRAIRKYRFPNSPSRHGLPGLPLLLLLLTAARCEPTGFEQSRVDIQYEERAVCGCFTEGGAPSTTQCAANDAFPRGAFIVYKIESVNNVDSDAKPFRFESGSLTALQSSEPGQPIGNYRTLQSFDVVPHTIQPVYQRWVLRVDNAGDPNSDHHLFYQNGLNRNVAMTRYRPFEKVVKSVCTPADLPPDGPGI